VDVLGHKDEGYQVEAELLARHVNELSQRGSPRVVGQEWPTILAGERELMQITGVMEVLDCLAMIETTLHGDGPSG
jgi:hypothetical protein